MNTIEELSLKAVFGIAKQDRCLLFDFCVSQNIPCSGKRIPYCNLEMLLIENKPVKGVEKEKIIKVLKKVQEQLNLKNKLYPSTQFLIGSKDFSCPFLKDAPLPCNFYICPYNSTIIQNTNCMLSTDNKNNIPLYEISIAKNIPKKKLLQIIFGIEVGNKWVRIENNIEVSLKTIKICKLCGHLTDFCKRNGGCAKREKAKKALIANSFVPEKLLKYPMILVISSSYNEFGDWAKHLFPKKALNLYVDSI